MRLTIIQLLQNYVGHFTFEDYNIKSESDTPGLSIGRWKIEIKLRCKISWFESTGSLVLFLGSDESAEECELH